jgi:hypothetical protein
MITPLYGQLSPLRVPTKAVRQPVSDADAEAYLVAVEAADLQPIEDGVANAINSFVIGCKADGIWSSIKSSCILAGARTLSGALIPLVGTAPTNANFVSGDYNRETGLKGNGSTKRIAANYAYPSALQNNCHIAIFQTGTDTGGHNFGAADAGNAGTFLVAEAFRRSRHYNAGTSIFTPTSPTYIGFQGLNRNSSSFFQYRSAAGTQQASIASFGTTLPEFSIFARSRPSSADNYSPVSQTFYSIGESLDLAALDTRVSTLMSDLAAAIP